MSERHQVNLNDEQYLLLEKVRKKYKNKINGLPKRGNTIAFMCDNELKSTS